MPQRTNQPASEQIVHDGARLARIKPRRRRHAAPRPVRRQCSGVGGRFFSDGDIDRGCNARCPRYLWPTRHNFRHSDAPPPLQQRRSTPPRHPAMARNRRIGRRGRLLESLLESADCQNGGGREALVTGVFLKFSFFENSPFWCLCGRATRNKVTAKPRSYCRGCLWTPAICIVICDSRIALPWPPMAGVPWFS